MPANDRSTPRMQERSDFGWNWTDSNSTTLESNQVRCEEIVSNPYTEYDSNENVAVAQFMDTPAVLNTIPAIDNLHESTLVDVSVRPHIARTVSSSVATFIQTYFEVEGGRDSPGQPCLMGEAILRDTDVDTPLLAPLPSQQLEKLHSKYFTPFQSLAEYELSYWLFKSRTTAGKMQTFFETSLEPWHRLTAIRTVAMWKQALHRIPYGIRNDVVEERQIIVSLGENRGELEYSVRYRSIMRIIEFLVGHEPFKDNLTYAPVRLYKDEEKTNRIYNEMHTGSWWWEVQKKLPPGSTVIPIIISSDKTQLTQHHGDKSSHPVYITIGNLDKCTRRSQTRPSKILLGFLPIPSKGDDRRAGLTSLMLKRLIYNQAMALMTESAARAETDGVRLRCADGQTRYCFPIVGGFVADYEEQVLITGIKSNQHCVICQVHPDKRENLTPLETNPLRSHQYTQDFIRALRSRKRKRRGEAAYDYDEEEDQNKHNDYESAMHIEDVRSFMWRFRRSNMHEVMHVDILHQLFKGINHRALNDWVYGALRSAHGETQADAILNQRFGAIPHFPALKTFPTYTALTQWTGVEQKALLRQVIPALAPVLSRPMIQFMRALVDFTLHAQYYSHDTDTLKWMEAALRRMDLLKQTFIDYTAAEGGFNFPKFHAISHYPMMIRKFGSADGYDTSMFEAGHKYMVKEWYRLSNKQGTFEQQILEHNQRAVNMLAMHDLLEHRLAQTLVPNKKEEPAQVTSVTRPKDLDNLHWMPSTRHERRMVYALQPRVPVRKSHAHLRKGTQYWRFASTVAEHTGIPNFLEALAVFVREERRRVASLVSSNIALNLKERDCSWVNSLLVCVHPSLICWKADRDDGSNTDVHKKEFVRCDPQWQTQREWRRDYVWIQEYTENEGKPRPLQGRLPGQLLIILSVLDIDRPLNKTASYTYTGAFVDVFTIKNQGKQSPRHGMIEAQRHPSNLNVGQRSLGYQRFYRLDLIQRSAHLVPAVDNKKGDFYINHYVDWDQYTTVYDEEFLEKDAKVAEEISKRHGWSR